MEDKLSRITERVVKISDDLPVVRKFLPFLGTETDLSRSTHAHLIYESLSGRTHRFLHGFFLSKHDKYLKNDVDWQRGLEVGPRNDLVNILRKGKPQTFDDLLMLTSFYLYSGPYSMDLLPVKPYTSDGSVTNQALDSILSKSKRWVLWQHQLDRIFAIFQKSRSVREKLLRDFRLQRPSAAQWMKQKAFPDGQRLSEVVEQRTWVRPPVSDPVMPFTLRLFNLLASDQGVHLSN